jgi:prevent-host-death family protein
MQISITEAKTKLSALIAAAERGEEIILTRRGKPVARIVAIAPKRLASRIDLAEDATRELLDALDALRQDLGLKREEERRD